jgi:YfiH family protein
VSLSLRSPLLTGLGFRHGFSLRTGGVSAGPYDSLNLGRTVGDDATKVIENQLRFARDVGYSTGRLYEVTQVHGARVERVDTGVSPDVFRAREADALVSLATGCAVAVKVADCVAVLLADPKTGAVAAVHAGWRGVAADVLSAAVQALAGWHGSLPANLHAAVFPCIGASVFEVGDEVAAALAAAVGSAQVVQRGAAKPHVDLALCGRLQLVRAGLLDEHVETVSGCTFSEPDRFFSYRRDGGVTGRHLAAIVPRC